MSETQAFLRVKQIAKKLGIGQSTWWFWVRTGKAPAGKKLGDRVTVWPVEVVQKFIDNAKTTEAVPENE